MRFRPGVYLDCVCKTSCLLQLWRRFWLSAFRVRSRASCTYSGPLLLHWGQSVYAASSWMMTRWLCFAAALPVLAQSELPLREAVQTALRAHPAMEAAASQVLGAHARIAQARGEYLPKVNYSESFARSDNPVFVFSSLLTQRQFTEANFAINTLNRPDFVNNFQSLATIDQPVYDWGGTRAQVRAAELGHSVQQEAQRRTEMDVVARVVRTYYGTVLAQAALETARSAVKSAEADLSRAESVRKSGLPTDVDVLSIHVHLAGIRETEIRRAYDVQVAIAALNEALGLPLGTQHRLTTPLEPAIMNADTAARYESAAVERRPEINQAGLAAGIARQQRAAARSALLPQVGVRGVFEADRQQFVNRGGANWLVTASLRWNLFDGGTTRARIRETEAALRTALAQQQQATAGIRLEVQKAWADFKSAEERIGVATASVAQAQESLRITKNRYAAGLATVTDLLRTETALLDTQTRRLAAIHDQRVAAVQLELAAGTLSVDSEVLQ